ncbi:MAG: chemotaxis protein [Candidatus Marinimicrobia bacterium]|nr:chemotaxis protein [Candidatus Neomarinimicrobiota bacterium]
MTKSYYYFLFLISAIFLFSNFLFSQPTQQDSQPNVLEEISYSTEQGAGIRRIKTVEEMTDFDNTMLSLAKSAARECSQILKQAIDQGIKTETEIFSTLYFPVIPLTSPPTFNTFYDDFCDSVITPVEDKFLMKNDRVIFVILVDKNGYVPAHNSIYSLPRTGHTELDIIRNRTKRIFNDITGFCASKNQSEFLMQLYRRDTGEIIADLSVPVFVKDKHWGAIRIGYLMEH